LSHIVSSDETPVMVIPYYDSAHRVVGLDVVGENACRSYHGHNMTGGVALYGVSARKMLAAWNDKWVITTSIEAAVAVSAAARRDHDMLYPLCLTQDPGTQDVRATLYQYNGLKSFVVWPACHTGAIDAQDLLLARRLGVPIAIISPLHSVYDNPVQWIAQHVITSTMSWLEALEQVVKSRTDWHAASLLGEIGWCPRIAAKAKKTWSPANYDRAEALINTTSWADIPISPELTVTETPEGLLNINNGQLLYEVLPNVTRVYRGDDGRTRYAGTITAHGASYPFDSATFCKDPVAVIDAVLLKAGVVPPAPHPMIVPHLASIARYRESAL
jgi:hypothetical protein